MPLPDKYTSGSDSASNAPERGRCTSGSEGENDVGDGEASLAAPDAGTVTRVGAGAAAQPRARDVPEATSEVDTPGRLLLTLGAIGRQLRQQSVRAAQAVSDKEPIMYRPPSPRDRVERIRRLDRELQTQETVPLLRIVWMGGEYVAAAVSTLFTLAASAVGTLIGLTATVAVLLALWLGLPI